MVAFRRYTSLADLIDILLERKISLRDPRKWDDKNDSYYLLKYKEHKRLKTVLALCFADRVGETYHHWQVFSRGSDGVSIRFDKDCILNAFREQCKGDGGVLPSDKRVEYVDINDLQCNPRNVDDLPFLKWEPYGDEREYRILFAHSESIDGWGFKIELDWIKHVSLSPWLPPVLEKSVKAHLRSICGCSRLPIKRSRVTDFCEWQAVADSVVSNASIAPSTRAESFDPLQLAGTWPGNEPLETLLEKLD